MLAPVIKDYAKFSSLNYWRQAGGLISIIIRAIQLITINYQDSMLWGFNKIRTVTATDELVTVESRLLAFNLSIFCPKMSI